MFSSGSPNSIGLLQFHLETLSHLVQLHVNNLQVVCTTGVVTGAGRDAVDGVAAVTGAGWDADDGVADGTARGRVSGARDAGAAGEGTAHRARVPGAVDVRVAGVVTGAGGDAVDGVAAVTGAGWDADDGVADGTARGRVSGAGDVGAAGEGTAHCAQVPGAEGDRAAGDATDADRDAVDGVAAASGSGGGAEDDADVGDGVDPEGERGPRAIANAQKILRDNIWSAPWSWFSLPLLQTKRRPPNTPMTQYASHIHPPLRWFLRSRIFVVCGDIAQTVEPLRVGHHVTLTYNIFLGDLNRKPVFPDDRYTTRGPDIFPNPYKYCVSQNQAV
ncbi:hypothetical protein FB451DRAFT_1164478 [Mycena latifolia]|nr:hypothetical protein FB451DRAFT_1164478 [Mycena latifolia]